MKKILLSLVVLTTILTSCKKDETDFRALHQFMIRFEIPAGLNPLETHYFPWPQEQSFIANTLMAEGIEREDIIAIRPAFADIRSDDLSDSFGFLRDVSLRIGEGGDTKIESFYIDRIPNNEDSILDLIPNDVDLLSKFSGDRLDIEMVLQLQNSNPVPITGNIVLHFYIQ